MFYRWLKDVLSGLLFMLTLAAFAPAASRVEHLFVPFRDATTGKGKSSDSKWSRTEETAGP